MCGHMGRLRDTVFIYFYLFLSLHVIDFRLF